MNIFNDIWKKYKGWRSIRKNKQKRILMEQYGKMICHKITEELDKNKIEFFFFFGTMLGFVREKEFIKHDNDIDVCVMAEDEIDWQQIEKILKNIGLKKRREIRYNGDITEQTYYYKKLLNIDFFACYNKEEYSEIYSYFRTGGIKYEDRNEYSVGMNQLSKIETCIDYDTLLGKMRIPINYLELLEELYGENWEIPDSGYRYEESPSWKILENKKGYCRKFK